MKKLILACAHSHTWMWTQTCLASLLRNPPKADGVECEIVVVNNSPWSPAIRGVYGFFDRFTEAGINLIIVDNHKGNKFHASALDCVVETFDFDYLMAWETDVLALRPTWLQWFLDQLKPTDFAVGMWHHENFVNPSCTLYRGDALRAMNDWCKTQAPQDELRWGENFALTAPLDNNLPLSENPASVLANLKEWIGGPFAEKRGFPEGTKLKYPWSGQLKGAGWMEPGQQLFHWATNGGYTYTVCPTETVTHANGMPISTFYGSKLAFKPDRQMEMAELTDGGGVAETVHLWGGTRALDILKHPVTCQFVGANTPYWLEREARFWRDSVPPEVQAQTLELIRRFGWHYRGCGTPEVTDRDREAVRMVQECYARGGIQW